MKYKTADLEGARLDAAVAKAEGREFALDDQGRPWPAHDGRVSEAALHHGPFRFSTSWQHGGPIIDREGIAFLPQTTADMSPPRVTWWNACVIDGPRMGGPTHLIAGMRAFVASKFGEEVEL